MPSVRADVAAPESAMRTLPISAPSAASARMLSRPEDSAASAAPSVSAITSAPPAALSNSVKPAIGFPPAPWLPDCWALPATIGPTAQLMRCSTCPAPSVKLTRTLRSLPRSSVVGV